MASNASLESLPVELLHIICVYLEKQDLVAFAQASSLLKKVAYRYVGRTIVLHISGQRQLQADIEHLQAHLQRNDLCDAVWTLKVTGSMPEGADDRRVVRKPRIRFTDDSDIPDYPTDMEDRYHTDTNLSCFERSNNEAWLPLALFISRLSHLSAINYECPNTFPPCLLDALKVHPGCKVHIDMFTLPSMFCVDPEEFKYEHRVARSPHLHSVTVASYDFGDFHRWLTGLQDNYGLALQWFVYNFPPNLRKLVTVDLPSPACSWRFRLCCRPTLSTLNKKWLKSQSRKVKKLSSGEWPKAKLDTLELVRVKYQDFEQLRSWCLVVDFSVLRKLHIDFNLTAQQLKFLIETQDLHSLASLAFKIFFATSHQGSLTFQEDAVEHYDLLCTLFNSLSPLDQLFLIVEGEVQKFTGLFSSIIGRHGPSLRSLAIRYGDLIKPIPWGEHRAIDYACTLDIETLKLIQTCCPNLADLEASVLRFLGSHEEVALYQTLGRMAHLRNLTLVLTIPQLPSVSYRPWGTPSPADYACSCIVDSKKIADRGSCFRRYSRYQGIFNARMSSTLFGKLHDLAINNTVDERLGRGIFRLISNNKPIGSFPLESLDIRAAGTLAHYYYSDRGSPMGGERIPFQALIECVRRRWRIARNVRVDRRHEIIATQVAEEHVRPQSTSLDLGWRHFSDLRSLVRSIWPDITDDLVGFPQKCLSPPLTG